MNASFQALSIGLTALEAFCKCFKDWYGPTEDIERDLFHSRSSGLGVNVYFFNPERGKYAQTLF